MIAEQHRGRPIGELRQLGYSRDEILALLVATSGLPASLCRAGLAATLAELDGELIDV